MVENRRFCKSHARQSAARAYLARTFLCECACSVCARVFAGVNACFEFVYTIHYVFAGRVYFCLFVCAYGIIPTG